MNGSLLCLDIGSGTQDALLYLEGREVENCPKFVLPAPARVVDARIRELTRRGDPVWLHGDNMGGGFYRAVKAHLEAGHAVAAHPDAAFSLGDDLALVEKLGVRLAESRPAGYVPVHLADFDPGFWRAFLGAAGLPYPELVLACAQDHGFHAGESNRRGRFTLWREFLQGAGGRPEALMFENPPAMLTRLRTLQAATGGGPVADTGAAAVLGALFMPEVEEASRRRGSVVLNLGNSHIVAFLLFDGRIWGVYEHHTGLRNADELRADLARFRRGELGLDEVFDGKGHGCMTLDLPKEAQGFPDLLILGPRRNLLTPADGRFLAPGGDMMLAGSFGLLRGWRYLQAKPAA